MSKARKIFLFSTLTVGLSLTACKDRSEKCKLSLPELLEEKNFCNTQWACITPTDKGFVRLRESYYNRDLKKTNIYPVKEMKIENDSVYLRLGDGWFAMKFGGIKNSGENNYLIPVSYLTDCNMCGGKRCKDETNIFLKIYDEKRKIIFLSWKISTTCTSGGDFGRKWLLIPKENENDFPIEQQLVCESCYYAQTESGKIIRNVFYNRDGEIKVEE